MTDMMYLFYKKGEQYLRYKNQDFKCIDPVKVSIVSESFPDRKDEISVKKLSPHSLFSSGNAVNPHPINITKATSITAKDAIPWTLFFFKNIIYKSETNSGINAIRALNIMAIKIIIIRIGVYTFNLLDNK